MYQENKVLVQVLSKLLNKETLTQTDAIKLKEIRSLPHMSFGNLLEDDPISLEDSMKKMRSEDDLLVLDFPLGVSRVPDFLP